MIDIICYYDNHQDVLFDSFFLPTYEKYLTSSFNLLATKADSKHKESSFESPNWCEIMIDRFDILKNYIKQNPSKWAIFSDIDIIFFNNFLVDILPYTYQDQIEIAYMPESNNPQKWYINGGFFFFKCSDYIYEYFDYIQTNVKTMQKPNDQKFIHNYLKNNNPDFRNSVLDSSVFAANNQDIRNVIGFIRSNTLKVFHSTSTLSLISKIQVLSTALCIHSVASQFKDTKDCRLWI